MIRHRPHWRFAAFLVRVQWIDRRATSSFLIGITLQTGVLTLALTRLATDATHALDLACRAALLTGVGIVLLSAMSSVANEFRYGTMENVLLGRMPFARLLAFRALACAVVVTPAVVVPFVGAVAAFPSLTGSRTVLVVAMVYVCLATLGYHSTLLLSQFTRPSAAVPWLRLALLLVGLSVLPFPGAQSIALVLPPAWVMRYATEAGEPGLPGTPLLFVAVTGCWHCLVWLLLRHRMDTRIERALTDGRAAW
ncbi:hypothetical protein [Streptomyces sp. C10-9-1]|uniref:hypothetical protein n=1 Tax=Streptomyces sp. C10-9-1 TaxID=1859285 RepID=UPI003D71D986